MVIQTGIKAPEFKVSTWVQGKPTTLEQERGKVVLVEVFQVNCPGCFMYALPEAISIYEKFRGKGLTVLGISTAFEDFELNTLNNLKKLLSTGEVIGETLRALTQYGQVKDGKKLPYKIPFPVAMDFLKKEKDSFTESRVTDFIEDNIPDYRTYNYNDRTKLIERVREYLKSKKYSAQTFETYALRGTPSSILIDKRGILRESSFGATGILQPRVVELLNE